MLHTLNRAWAKTLAQHTNQKIMFVYTTPEEQEMLINVFNEVQKEIGDLCFMWVTNKEEIEKYMKDGKEIEMQDDILVSHDLHYDIFLMDYLGRHCKRKCC